MYTLRLEIKNEKLPGPQNEVRYPVKVTKIDPVEKTKVSDRLIIKTRTIDQLEKYLECLDHKLRRNQHSLEREVTEEIDQYLQAVGFTDELISSILLTERLAVGIGHLLLTKILFTSKTILSSYEAGCLNTEFRLQLIIEPQELRKWPWEFLWDRKFLSDDLHQYYDGFLGIPRNKTISHSLDSATNLPGFRKPDRPLRILFAVADPKYRDTVKSDKRRDLDKILGTRQLAQITAALRGWCKVVKLEAQPKTELNDIKTTKIEIYSMEQCSLSKLEEVLEKYNQPPFDVFHFVGHGWFSNEAGLGYCLAFESEEGDGVAREIPAKKIGELLKQHGISFIVLNGCQTSQERETAEGLAQTIASFNIPAVIGMRYSIRNIDSIDFASHFFGGVLDEKPLDFLINDTRNVLGRRCIYDELYDRETFRHGIQYLYPTAYLTLSDEVIPTDNSINSHLDNLEKMEKTIPFLGRHPKADIFIEKNKGLALGPLWIALLSDDVDSNIRLNVATQLGKLDDELAVYPLTEALTVPDETLQKVCREALERLAKNPSALDSLVSIFVEEGQIKVLDVIRMVSPEASENAVWLREAVELHQILYGFYQSITSNKQDKRAAVTVLNNLIEEIMTIYRNYQDRSQEEQQLYLQIKDMDRRIETLINGISDETRAIFGSGGPEKDQIDQEIISRERIREDKDKKDNELNELLESFLNRTYQLLSEILGFLNLNEIALDTLEQTLSFIIERGKLLPLAIPIDTQKKVKDEMERLSAIKETIQALLDEDSTLRKFIRIVEDFRRGFSPTS